MSEDASSRRRVSADEARKELIDLVRQGHTISDGLKVVGRSRSWYDAQRRAVEGFSVMVDGVRLRQSDAASAARKSDIGFLGVFAALLGYSRVAAHAECGGLAGGSGA